MIVVKCTNNSRIKSEFKQNGPIQYQAHYYYSKLFFEDESKIVQDGIFLWKSLFYYLKIILF
jgi:hypothetical protein